MTLAVMALFIFMSGITTLDNPTKRGINEGLVKFIGVIRIVIAAAMFVAGFWEILGTVQIA